MCYSGICTKMYKVWWQKYTVLIQNTLLTKIKYTICWQINAHCWQKGLNVDKMHMVDKKMHIDKNTHCLQKLHVDDKITHWWQKNKCWYKIHIVDQKYTLFEILDKINSFKCYFMANKTQKNIWFILIVNIKGLINW